MGYSLIRAHHDAFNDKAILFIVHLLPIVKIILKQKTRKDV